MYLKDPLSYINSNIIDKQPLEKMKMLKFSQILQDSVNELITLGVGIRDKDSASNSTWVSFKQWDDFVESNIKFKIDPTQLSREEKEIYLTDSATENLW